MPVPMPQATTSERAALILAEAIGHRRPGSAADKEVCAKYGITTRTLRRHRERMERDERLSAAVRALLAPSRERWSKKLSAAKEHVLQALLDSVAAQDPSKAESLSAIADALRTIQRSALEEVSVDVFLAEKRDSSSGDEQDDGHARPYVLVSETPDPGPSGSGPEEACPDIISEMEPAAEASLVLDRRTAP